MLSILYKAGFRSCLSNTEKLDENIQKNSILVTALVPKLGYDTAADVAKLAVSSNSTIKSVLLEKALLTEEVAKTNLELLKQRNMSQITLKFYDNIVK